MWDKSGYFLEGNKRRSLDDRILPKDGAVSYKTSESLKGLGELISDKTQRAFLDETMSCYRAGAFRATIIMAWNLAYDHFTRWLLADAARLSALNDSWTIKYPKKPLLIKNINDFADAKEFEIIETAQHAKVITKNIAELMKDKLKKRNAAAHPSQLVITQAQADDTVTDLVHNVILAFQ